MKSARKNHRRRGNGGENCQEVSNLQTNENSPQKNPNPRKRNKKLYSIAQSDLLGRYLTANKNITAGEIIIEKDEPLVIGPVQQSQLVCLGCYLIIKNVNDYRCTKCNWPMCSASCSGLYKKTGHDIEECKILADISFDGEMERDVINVYNFIVPLRCLLFKKSSQSKWNTLMSMESHTNVRKNIKTIWNLNAQTVVQKIEKYFDPDEIHTVCGILEVNCFEVTKDELSLRALFPLAFLLSHNCVPNTIHTNDEQFQLKVRASVDIPKGEPITISYAYTLHGTVRRRAHIKETKFFDCTCDRCADPIELGTNNSTIICPKCNHASLVSSSPLVEDTRWICKYRKCSGFTVSESYVHDLIEKHESELKLISDDDVEMYEIWLKRAASNLHENHYLILGVKYTLSLLYGKIPGYMLQEMNEDLLRRKVTICEDLLKIADIIEPGLSRLRGMVLYELHAPLMMLASQKFKSQNVSKKQLKHSLQKIIHYLKEACLILEFESEYTTEGQIALAARQALESTYEWEKSLGKMT